MYDDLCRPMDNNYLCMMYCVALREIITFKHEIIIHIRLINFCRSGYGLHDIKSPFPL